MAAWWIMSTTNCLAIEFSTGLSASLALQPWYGILMQESSIILLNVKDSRGGSCNMSTGGFLA